MATNGRGYDFEAFAATVEDVAVRTANRAIPIAAQFTPESSDKVELKRAKLPRPRGKAMSNSPEVTSFLKDLEEQYSPETIAGSMRKNVHDYGSMYFVPANQADPVIGGHHRLQIVESLKEEGGEVVPKLREWKVKSGKDLKTLSETVEYRRSRWYEATGEWCQRGPTSKQWKRLCEGTDPRTYGDGSLKRLQEARSKEDKKAAINFQERTVRERGLRQMREGTATDPFGNEPGDRVGSAGSFTDDIDQEFIPILGGPYFRNQYLFGHWEQTAKAFYEKNHSELARAAIEVTSDFVLGRGIHWKIKHQRVREIWEEFWHRNKMDWRLEQLSDDLSWQGELLVHTTNQVKGYVKVREIDPSVIYEIITELEDVENVLFYHHSASCLHGDTEIACLDGTTPTVQELAERDEPFDVYSYDLEGKRIAPGQATKAWKSGNKRCVKVTLDNGEEITCTFDHPFLMRDGEYVWAENLRPDASLMPLYRRIGYEDVWQPETGWERTHHMVAGKPEKGHVVHHDNKIRTDNRPDNLLALTDEDHTRLHSTEARGRMAKSSCAFKKSPEWRRKVSEKAKERWKDPKRREKAAEQARAQWSTPEGRKKKLEGMKKTRPVEWREGRAAAASGNNHKVVSVEPAGMHDVYDIEVPTYHNFALAAGVFTHNTQYQLPYQSFNNRQLDVGLINYTITQYPASDVFHIKNNVSHGEKWGRSDFFASLGTLKRHRDWVNAVTLKDLLQSNLIWTITLTGDDGDIDSFMSDPQNAQLPGFGGLWVQNDALKLEALHQDVGSSTRMGSGTTGQFLTALFAAAQSMPLAYFNMQEGGAARATALQAGEPFSKKIVSRHQTFTRMLNYLYEKVMIEAIEGGRLEASDMRHEDADPEWEFPTIFEEDRGALFTDLISARGQASISHRSMSVKMGAELGMGEYDYDREQDEIEKERDSEFLSLWPPHVDDATTAVTPGTTAGNPIPAVGEWSKLAPGKQPGEEDQDHAQPGHASATAHQKRSFKMQQRHRRQEAEVLTEGDLRFLEAAVGRGVTGVVKLPSGKTAEVPEK